MTISTHRPLPADIKAVQENLARSARRYGLDFFDTIFEVVDYEEMSMLAAFGGFPQRYPHWRFGDAVRRVDEGLFVRPAEDLRDGHQYRALLRLPTGGQCS